MVREVLENSDSKFNDMLKQASDLERLQNLLRRLVNPDLANHFQVAAVRKNRLILITPTAPWATNIRMQAPQIVRSLHHAGVSTIDHIDIRVAPLVEELQKKRSPRELTPAAKQALDCMTRLEDDKKE